MKNNKYLFLITLTYFALGFVNIHFATLMLVCLSTPLIVLFYTKKKTWCQGYCPRSRLIVTTKTVFKGRSAPTPEFFSRGDMKWIIFAYFIVALFLMAFSTYSVYTGKITLMDYPRLFILIPLPKMFQLFTIDTAPWLLHLCYRFYSMMLSTTVLALLFSLLYRPRTWCTVCPIMTISSSYLKK